MAVCEPISWTSCLDALEADLVATEGALAAGEPPATPPWSAPILVEAPTEEETRRAVALNVRLQAVLEALAGHRDGVSAELESLDGRRHAARSYGQSAGA